MLVRASVHELAIGGVSLEPSPTYLGLRAILDSALAMTASCVLCHVLSLPLVVHSLVQMSDAGRHESVWRHSGARVGVQKSLN